MMNNDEYWMRRCFALAVRGRGSVQPNPMVGAVIVHHGKKIAEGFHKVYGGPHAEAAAISDAVRRKKRLDGATLYVNLEPCSHFGKTPPCVENIIRHRFSRVVIATKDPNPLVSGRGIKILEKNGIDCSVGILRDEAVRLNRHFFTYITKQIPYVAIKAAQTHDGYMASSEPVSRWISNAQSRTMAHRLRSEFQAILVGASTVAEDDPELTVRRVKGHNPIRIIVDGKFSVRPNKKIFSAEAPTLVYVAVGTVSAQRRKASSLKKTGVEIVEVKGRNGIIKPADILADLGKRKILSVLIEGGQETYAHFLNARSVQTIYLFTSKKKFGNGLKTFENISVSYHLSTVQSLRFGSDSFKEYSVRYSKIR